MVVLRLFWAAALAASIAACHSDTGPDLSRLYASGTEQARAPPVILIPGILGSRLFDKSKRTEIWPGATLRLLAGSKQNLELPFDPRTLQPVDDGLEPSGLFEEVLNADFYGAILRTLRQSGGFVEGNSACTPIRGYDAITYLPMTGGKTMSRARCVSMR